MVLVQRDEWEWQEDVLGACIQERRGQKQDFSLVFSVILTLVTAGVTGGLCSGDCAGVTGGLSSTGGGVEGRICGDSWAEAGAGVLSSSDLVELPSLVSEAGSEPGKREKRGEGSGSNRLSSPTASTGF